MSAKLIYHTPESMAGGVSPFDAAITDMVSGRDIRIACPYLGLDYLQRLIRLASDWRLLTDATEWLLLHSQQERDRIISFIQNHINRIRHCKGIHAKVIIAENKALAGSANFTEKGITGRVEMSVLFEGCDQVEQLQRWFEQVWKQSSTIPATDDLQKHVISLPPRTLSCVVSMPCSFPGVTSTLQNLVVARCAA